MIGIFDSGIGGLTVLKAVQKRLPQYQLLYLGDTARTPYGNRSQDLIYEFTEQAVDFLFKQGCQLVITACNTVSSEALRRIQQEWLPAHYPDRRVLGVVRPVAEEAVKISRYGKIGVVGTRGTISSGAYERELAAQRPDAQIFSRACPLLVPLIEEGFEHRSETMKILRNYLRPLKAKKIDTLILGCTHYPLMLREFRKAAGNRVKVPDPARIVAEKLADYLSAHPEIESKLIKGSAHHYIVTDRTEIFQKNAEEWLGHPLILEKTELAN